MGNDNGERIMPTRAGWWWYGDEVFPSLIEVAEKDGALVALATNRDILVTPGALRWLAPIYGPAVCAALADCEAAELAWANGDLDDELLERAVTNAEARLYAAMRAERDGAA